MKTIRDIPLKGLKVLIRADLNVPLKKDGVIANDRRIRCTIPTIRAAIDAGAAVIVMSHLGRPTGDPAEDAKFQMDRVAARLADLLRQPVRKADQVVGPDVSRVARSLKPGEVFVLENLRFHPGEKKGDEAFAVELAALGDVYVNDAFGTCHNKDASMIALPRRFPESNRVAGLLLERELQVLDGLLDNPKFPMVALMGGAKVSDKIRLIERLVSRVEKFLIGGAMAYTFMAAAGRNVGRSKVEPNQFENAKRLAQLAGQKLTLPVDHLVADDPERPTKIEVVSGEVPPNGFGMDIGPATIAAYESVIARAGTVVWNGPMGKFEDDRFSRGTREIAKALTKSKAVTVIGGGETAEAIEDLGLADRMAHVSTGGGAFLTYLGGEKMEAIEALNGR